MFLRGRRRTLYAFLWLVPLFALLRSASGQSLQGRSTTALYAFERAPGPSGESQHLRGYQTLDLTISRLGWRGLSFHLYGFASTDLRSNTVDDPRLWLYSAYLRYDFQGGELRIGRQRVFAGVGFGTVDGISGRYLWDGRAEAEAYAGLQMPLTEGLKVDSWDESHMFGGRLRSAAWQKTRLAMSFVQKSRARKVYLTPGEFTANRWLLEKISALQQRRLGFDAWHSFGPAELSARLDYDLLWNRVQRAECNARGNLGKVEVGLDYIFRNPLVDWNSIFGVFSQRSNQEIAGRVLYVLSREVGLFARAAWIGLEGESSRRFSLGLRARGGTLGLAHQSGYGGDRWGLVGDYRWKVNKKLWLHVSSDYNTYRYYGLDAEWEYTLAGTVGATWYPSRGLRLDLEFQGLQNPHLDSDLRALLRASYSFRT